MRPAGASACPVPFDLLVAASDLHVVRYDIDSLKLYTVASLVHPLSEADNLRKLAG